MRDVPAGAPVFIRGVKVGLVLGRAASWAARGSPAASTRSPARPAGIPASADHIVGTCAGSMIGALVAAGVPPWFMVAHSAGETFEGLHRRPTAGPRPRPTARGGAVFRCTAACPPHRPRLAGSWSPTALAAPHAHTPAGAAAPAGCPRGVISTDPLKDIVRRAVPERLGRPPEPLGRRLRLRRPAGASPFGRADAPHADLADAVAASCAIPGFYRPVEIGGRATSTAACARPRTSTCSRDARARPGHLPEPDLDARTRRTARNPVDRVAHVSAAAPAAASAPRRRSSARAGTEVVLIQPTREDLEVMGAQPDVRRATATR